MKFQNKTIADILIKQPFFSVIYATFTLIGISNFSVYLFEFFGLYFPFSIQGYIILVSFFIAFFDVLHFKHKAKRQMEEERRNQGVVFDDLTDK